MYSVLFLSQRTMDYFDAFRPIFLPLLTAGKIGVCQWMEAGTTVDTAMPGIYDLINDKEEWRAVILCTNEPEDQKAFPSKAENPYDFLENASSDICTKESPIPLIRLTQMLGGVPAPVMHFEQVPVPQKNKEVRMIYKPGVREEDRKAYEELKSKYEFCGRMPREIILVCPRTHKANRNEKIEEVWRNRSVEEASDFWRRNGYPACCRFTVFDISREGEVRKTEELFNLWTSVMLLAANDIDPSTLQAYRLYRICVEFNRRKLELAFQETAGRVQRARQSIEKSIKRELEQRAGEDVILPDYELRAPVVLKLPEYDQVFPGRGRFGLTSRSPASDQEILWEMKEEAQKGLDSLVHCTDRALDQTALRIRQCCSYTEKEVYSLNPYQREDMDEKLEQEYREIFAMRSRLPGSRGRGEAELERLTGNIRSVLAERTTGTQAIAALAGASALFALSMTPALFAGIHGGGTSLLTAAGFVVSGAGVFAGAELLCLLSRKAKLQLQVGAFHRFMGSLVTELSEDGQQFSRYMSKIASYMHGNSFLSALRRSQLSGQEAFAGKKQHIAALTAFYSSLREWCRAYHLQMYFDSLAMNDELAMNTELAPEINPMYTFATDECCPVEVNHTGDTIDAPFDFIRKLKIIREELYDDAD